MRVNGYIGLAATLVASLAATGCERMWTQPMPRPYAKTRYFDDQSSARELVDDTVSREFPRTDPKFYAGLTRWPKKPRLTVPSLPQARPDLRGPVLPSTPTPAPGNPFPADVDYVQRIPMRVDAHVMKVGHDRFDVYCTPCHGGRGDGNGPVTRFGFPHPPSYHVDRLRNAPDGYLFDVITNGFGMMYGYAHRLSPGERWAVVAWVRALQTSQHTRIDAIGGPARKRLEEEAR